MKVYFEDLVLFKGSYIYEFYFGLTSSGIFGCIKKDIILKGFSLISLSFMSEFTPFYYSYSNFTSINYYCYYLSF